jgi:1,3-beta-glucanosyltransferase GAS3
VRGNSFVNPATGNKFQIVGVAYQPKGSAGYDPARGKDPLSNGEICKRDAAIMQTMGINAIRVYNLNPDINHDECASVFNAAGMYMLLDVNSPLPGESIHNLEPWTSYHKGYLNRTFAIVEAFKNYPNTLLFFSGNEVVNDVATAKFVPPYLRAVTRDLKNYVKKHCDRPIPVGYSAADVRSVLVDSWNYLQCAENGDVNDPSRVDVFALNSYSWCGESDMQKSTYDQLVEFFKASSVPIFFSEYGCNSPRPNNRPFTEVGAIYGSAMNNVFSGGVAYEYSEEPNIYGIVKISDSDGSATMLGDYKTLSSQVKKLDFTALQGVKASTTNPTPPVCSSALIKQSGFNNSFTIPAVPEGAQDIINNGVSPKPSGKIIPISSFAYSYKVINADGNQVSKLFVNSLGDATINSPGTNTGGSSNGSGSSGSNGSNGTDKNAGSYLKPTTFAVMLPLVAALFA